jgi:hypothetical protein
MAPTPPPVATQWRGTATLQPYRAGGSGPNRVETLAVSRALGMTSAESREGQRSTLRCKGKKGEVAAGFSAAATGQVVRPPQGLKYVTTGLDSKAPPTGGSSASDRTETSTLREQNLADWRQEEESEETAAEDLGAVTTPPADTSAAARRRRPRTIPLGTLARMINKVKGDIGMYGGNIGLINVTVAEGVVGQRNPAGEESIIVVCWIMLLGPTLVVTPRSPVRERNLVTACGTLGPASVVIAVDRSMSQ